MLMFKKIEGHILIYMPSSELSGVFCYVYILYPDKSKQFYVGFTHDLQRRYAEHNAGLSFATKPYKPWSMLYFEAHTSKEDALRREKYLKTSQGKQALRRMLCVRLTEMQNLNHQKVYY